MGKLLGGGSSCSSTTTVNVPGPTEEEIELTKQQIELQKLQIDILKENREEQGLAFEFLQDSLDELNRATQEAADDPIAKELQDIQLDIIRRGGKASPEERESIAVATEAALEEGSSDIEAFSEEAISQVKNILAPSRGLRPTDTPIQDRAFEVAGEATRQLGQLERNLRGAQATAELNFPLARGEFTASVAGFQQQLQEGSRNFQQSLRDAAFENQLRLAGLQQQSSLGLLGVSPSGASALQSLAAVRAAQTTTTSSFDRTNSPGLVGIAQGVGGFLTGLNAVSSRALKTKQKPVNVDVVVEILDKLPLETWFYRSDDELPGRHLGTYAEEFQAETGLGDGKTINLLDLTGLLFGAVKSLSTRVKELENGVSRHPR